MGMDDERERPKKSWREIDKQRDGSAHRRDAPKSGKSAHLERTQAYRSYKTQLNKLFDGGGLPDALKAKLDEAGVGAEAKARSAAAEAIVAATAPKDVVAALAAYRDLYGFPEEEQVLVRLLDLSDEGVVLETLQAIGRLLVEGRIKRGASLKARLRTVQMSIDAPEVQSLGRELLNKL